MIIDITGFGWSGSGAVIGLLSEYDEVCPPKLDGWEFTFIHGVDGIADLEYKLISKHCRVFDSDMAIRRFLHFSKRLNDNPFFRYKEAFDGKFYGYCVEYIECLTDISFSSRTYYDKLYNNIVAEIIRGGYNKLMKSFSLSPFFLYKGFRPIRLSYNPNDFMPITQDFVQKLLNCLKTDQTKMLMTDHMLPPDCPELFYKYFKEPVRCIVVRRDPRDTYILAKEIYKGMMPVPTDTVDKFICFYRKTIEETKCERTAQTISIQFEDLIYRYSDTVSIIEEFLGVKKHHLPKSVFNPEVSIRNTRLFEKFPKYASDIERIERALPASLYKFPQASVLMQKSGKVF